MKKLSLDLRVSQILGVRFLSGLVLWLIFMSLVGWGLLFLFELSPRSWQPVLGPCMHLAWPFIAAPMVLWSHDKIWRRSVTIRDIGSQIAIKVGHRERCHAWDDLRKVKVSTEGQSRYYASPVMSLNLVLIFKGRTYRLGTDEHIEDLRSLERYCQSKIRNRRKKAKKSK
ncbi:hypothetical protein [Abiotrophia defectiva]